MLGSVHEVQLPTATVRYREAGPADAPVVVFVHGFAVNGLLWRHVVAALAGRYRCLVLEMPAGAHEIPVPDADLSLPGLAHLVGDALAALDVRDVTLVGNDSGGAVVQAVAAHRSERVARIVLTPCDTFDEFPPSPFRYLLALGWVPGGLWLLAQTARLRPVQRLPIAFGRLVRRPIPREIMDAYLAPMHTDRRIRRDGARLLRSIRSADLWEVTRRLPDFEGPALLVWHRGTGAFSLDHAEVLARLLPDARLVTVEDTAAFIPEDQPAALATAIEGFLEQTAATPATQPPNLPRSAAIPPA